MVERVTIRPAGPDDAEVITHHRREMFVDMRGGVDAADLDVMDASFLPTVRRALADGSYRGWLACVEDGCVVAGGGLLVYDWLASPGQVDTRKAYILNVYTEPAYRRRGIARRILNEIVACCRSEGFSRVFLHASAQGRPLYASLGFEPTNEMTLRME